MSVQLERRVKALEKAVGMEQPDVEQMPGFESWMQLFGEVLGPDRAREATRGFFLECLERGEDPTWAALAKMAAEGLREGLQPCPDV